MAFQPGTLTNYVDQSSTKLITAAQFEGETASYANVQAGIKSSAALQILSVSPIPQVGGSCGFTASGDDTFTQRTIVASPVKFEGSWCPKTLETKWTQLLLKAGQKYTEADIPSQITDEIVKSINARLETADWMGDLTSGSSYINIYDGLVKIIDAASGVVDASASTYNSSNCRTIVANILTNIPAALKGNPNVKIYMGYDATETYRQKVLADNLYHFAPGEGAKNMMAEGSVHEIVPVHGLDGTSRIFAIDFTKNVYMGVDMLNEEEQARMWVDGSDGETIKYRFAFRRGWQIAIPSEIVSYQNA